MNALNTDDISINPEHDARVLGKSLRANGRLQIPNFFSNETAEKLGSLLEENKIWHIAYNEGEQASEMGVGYMAKRSPQERMNFWNSIMNGAKSGFQYLFHQYNISSAVERGENRGHPLHIMHQYVNGDSFLAFMSALTDNDEITRSDSYATQYGPNHFLLAHDDKYDAHNRVAAYVISMTREWKHDWGGHLVFYDDAGNIEEGYVPSFNTLNIFLVPKPHAVTYIPPFTPKLRHSFLGWLRKD